MLYGRLRPFLNHELLAWQGLPTITVAELSGTLGSPAETAIAALGFYAADRYTYPLDVPSQGLVAYVRQNQVVLIEALIPPPLSAVEALPEPCGIKAQEIVVPNAYAHEYVYCDRGLVLTIAETLDHRIPNRLVRCRGIPPIATADDFGPAYYKSFEDQIYW